MRCAPLSTVAIASLGRAALALGNHRRRSPVFVIWEGVFQAGLKRRQSVRQPRWCGVCFASDRAVKCGAGVGNEIQRRLVHEMVVGSGGYVDHSLRCRVPWVLPARTHLDGVVTHTDNQIGLFESGGSSACRPAVTGQRRPGSVARIRESRLWPCRL